MADSEKKRLEKATAEQLEMELKSTLGNSGELIKEIISLNNGSEAVSEKYNPVFSLGEQDLDPQIKIVTRNSDMEASICVYSPPPGGNHVTLEMVKKAIDSKKIVYGIDWEIIEDIVEEKLYDSVFTFAEGDRKVDGEDGFVTARYDETRKMKPRLMDDGSVDFRDLGAVINIRVGDPICDITQLTEGSDGKNILGEIIKATPGKPPKIPMGANTAINGDGSMLIAQKDGNLIFDKGKFNVETDFIVKGDVDISTGNLSFIGNIVIKGNVEASFRVESEKDITVDGMVSGATLKAGGNIIVRNGVVNSEIFTDSGNVQIGFGESTKIICKGSLKATSLVSCSVNVEGDLECTNQPGTIVGGMYIVSGNLSCNTLGHRNYILTTIELGNFAQLSKENNELIAQNEKIDADIAKLDKITGYFNELRKKGVMIPHDKEALVSGAVRLKMQKAKEKKPIAVRMVEISTLTGNIVNLIARINKVLHPNVKISISGVTTITKNEYGKCVVRLNQETEEIQIS